MRCGIQRLWLNCPAIWIAPDVSYELDASGVYVLVVCVDPESELGSGLSSEIESGVRIVPNGALARWREQLGPPSELSASRIEPWVQQHLLATRPSRTIHPGVRRVLAVLRAQLPS